MNSYRYTGVVCWLPGIHPLKTLSEFLKYNN